MLLERNAVVSLDEGLHARPAARLAQLAKSFQSSIDIIKGEKSANAKSTVKIMLLTVKEGDQVRFRAEGEDAELALMELAAFVGGRLDDASSAARSASAAPRPAMTELPVEMLTTMDTIPHVEHAGAELPSRIQGISGNEGVAVGPAFVYIPDHTPPQRRALSPNEIDPEIQRFRRAVLQVCCILDEARTRSIEADPDSTEAQVFAALKELAQDIELLDPIEQRIASGVDAASSTLDVGMALADRFAKIDDAYFRMRADDVRGIARQIAANILGRRGFDLSELTEPSILVAADLSALDFARLPTRFITGLLTTEGGATSHVSIIARALGFPAVVGARASVEQLRSARTIALDGSGGFAVLNPDAAMQASFQSRVAESVESRRSLERYTHIEPTTKDGVWIEVAANVGSAAEAEAALQSGAMGVGLFRTEFMFMRGAALPTEQEQFRIYSRVLSIFAPRPVLIRTLDVGGDKPLPGVASAPEANPFLGWRGIRMCLDQPELFNPQLRALLRAACHGKLRIMFPMISDLSEVVAAKASLRDCRQALQEEGIETGPIEIGIMIETPAAALCAHELAKHVDFFSIGTNDLTQYTMAADRTNARLERLSRVDHPAVLKMIEMACDGARAAGIWVGVCGEAAGDPVMIPRLLSWGVTELSMSPSLMARAKKLVTEYRSADQAPAASGAQEQALGGMFVGDDDAGAQQLDRRGQGHDLVPAAGREHELRRVP